MNELTFAAAALTMPSREIAELVESRHDSMKVTIERLVDRSVIASPQSEGKPIAGIPALVSVNGGAACETAAGCFSHEADARALKARVIRLIDIELGRCRSMHGPANWAEHGEWVKAYVLTSVKQWLFRAASEGAL